MIRRRVITSLLFSMISLVFCCNKKNNVSTVEEKIHSESQEIIKDSISITGPKLDGVWSESNDTNENADFLIENDTIVYFDNFENPYKFNMCNDTLWFNYSNGVYKILILKLTKDTLILFDLESEVEKIYNKRQKQLRI